MSATLDDVRRRLIDAMALPDAEHAHWLEIAEQKLYAERARLNPFKRMYDVSTVGARMRTARQVCGMGLAQAAIRMGVNPSHLSLWERGKRNLPANKLHVIALVLGVKLKWLLMETDEGGPPVPREQLRKRITQHWKDRQTALTNRAKARAEAAKLNRIYARVKANRAAESAPKRPTEGAT